MVRFAGVSMDKKKLVRKVQTVKTIEVHFLSSPQSLLQTFSDAGTV